MSGGGHRLDQLCDRLGHHFANPDLLTEALTHPSVERGPGQTGVDYNRLEFLGDRVLGVTIASELFARHPKAEAGVLALHFNALVRRETLAEVARDLDLGPHIILSRSERAAGGDDKPALLADVVEALIAALYLDGGWEAARRFVLETWRDRFDQPGAADKDAKTALQEWSHQAGHTPPEYRVVREEGPPHAPLFTVEVSVGTLKPASGQGGSKRVAQQAAAEALLNRERDGGDA